MQLTSLTMEELNIPFKVQFQHSSAARSSTEAVLVTAKTLDGAQGLGEGCPRSYVTGETLATVQKFFAAHHHEFIKIDSVDALRVWVDRNAAEIDKNPAAFCAVELALLDALAKTTGQSVETLLSLPKLSGEFQYTGVLGVKKPTHFQAQFQQYLDMGFRDFKVKVFGEPAIDRANAETLKAYSHDNIRIRLDANNLWSSPKEAIEYIRDLNFPIFAVEEPVAAFDYDGCKKIFEQLETAIILDESFTREEMFQYIQGSPASWIVNLRISKMGGLIRSLKVAAKARTLNIPIIIGAQVGETSILTRAALTVANAYRDNLLAQEGAYGTHLLEHDVMDRPIMFGREGVLQASSCK